PLRRWRLLELGAGPGLLHSPLRLDERILHFLAGLNYLDEQLAGYVTPLAPAELLPAGHEALARQIAATWLAAQERAAGPLPLVQLLGEDAVAQEMLAAAAGGALGLNLWRLPAGALPSAPAELELLQRLWEREAILGGRALLLSLEGPDAAEASRQGLVERFINGLHSPLFLAGRQPARDLRRPALLVDVRPVAHAERLALWQATVGRRAAALDGQLEALTGQFQLNAAGMQAAWLEATATTPETEDLAPALWAACRRQARPHLEELAQRLEPAATWDDLILPERERAILADIARCLRWRSQVYERWGFARRSERGLGLSALFSGPSGTGKTLAAEVLANALGLDLYRIDLSQVVSKYIGETEKNLARVFQAAEAGAAILLFDEADALFGRRSEVKDSHDRYANIEIGYLLQRMEAYRGLAILTTNMKEALDGSFLRRLRFVANFPFPDAGQRAAIWARTFPAETPTEDLDLGRLAQLNVTGGSIRNIALTAAFYAAAEGRPVGMGHIFRAAEREYIKLEKSITASESRGWNGAGSPAGIGAGTGAT
ncbi:MAG: ATP-binding protein, partial [Candidatus Promineifilaceae bacterium]